MSGPGTRVLGWATLGVVVVVLGAAGVVLPGSTFSGTEPTRRVMPRCVGGALCRIVVCLEGGADIRYIQAMLGHAELSTTQIYTQVSIRALQAVHTATHPGATNTRHRSPFTDPDVEGDSGDETPDGDAMTDHQPHDDVEGLFSVVAEGINQENRADPGSPRPRRPR